MDKFGAWLRARGAIPTVVALRQRFEAIRRAELERLEFKLSALPPDARARVDEITHLIVEKLLLTPTEQLKSLGDAETVGAYAEALTRLFGLAQQQADEEAGPDAHERGRVEPFPDPQQSLAALGPVSASPKRFDSARVAANSRCGRRTPSPRASPQPADRPAEIVVIKTSGDRLQDAPLSEVGGKRLFVKEIEDALLRGDIDLAVHSSKDMPAVLPDGLAIAGVLPREDPLDAVVLPSSPAPRRPHGSG